MSDLRTLSREFMTEFIELYRANPCLWRTKSKEYLDKNKKNEAYNALLNLLKSVDPNATENTVLSKINTLRGGFRREFKKMQESKRSGSGSDQIYAPTLWYFDLLLFVKDQEIPRKSISNVPVEDDQEGGDSESLSGAGVEELGLENEPDENSAEHVLSSQFGTKELTTTSSSATTTPRVSRKTKRVTQGADKADEILAIVRGKLQAPDDECSVIGKNIAFKLRRLPKDMKLFAEKLMNDVLFEAELGQLNRNTCIALNSGQQQAAATSSYSHLQFGSGACDPSVNTYQILNLDNSNTAAYLSSYNPQNIGDNNT